MPVLAARLQMGRLTAYACLNNLANLHGEIHAVIRRGIECSKFLSQASEPWKPWEDAPVTIQSDEDNPNAAAATVAKTWEAFLA
jgi:hypothetical protein